MPNINSNPGSVAGSPNVAVPTSRRVNTTGPLVGGGALSSDLTLSLDMAGIGDAKKTSANIFTAQNRFEGITTFLGNVQVSGTRSIFYGSQRVGTLGTGSQVLALGNFYGDTGFAAYTSSTLFGWGLTVVVGSGTLTGHYDFGQNRAGDTADFNLPVNLNSSVFANASATFRGETQLSGTTIAHAPVYSRSAIGLNRYVTSGDLAAAISTVTVGSGGGGGDAYRGQPNFFTAANVFVGPVTISGLTQFGSAGKTKISAAGDVQISGSNLMVYGAQTLGDINNYSNSLILGNNGGDPGFQAYTTATFLGFGLTVLVGSGSMTGHFDFEPNRTGDIVKFGLPINANSTLAVAGRSTFSNDVQLSGSTTLAHGPIYSRSQIGVNRYVTSGELGAGTGDAIKGALNYWTGAENVFGPSTNVQISGVASFGTAGTTRISAAGDAQVSGTLTVWDRAVIGQDGHGTRGIRFERTGNSFGWGYEAWVASGLHYGTLEFYPFGVRDLITFYTNVLVFNDFSIPNGVFLANQTKLQNTQVSGTTLSYGPIYARTQAGANRYVTSGEMSAGSGTGDAVRNAANFWTGSPNVFSATTLVHVSGLASFGSSGGTRISAAGDVQVSGGMLVAYGSQRVGNKAAYSESFVLGDPTTSTGFAAYASNSVLGYSLQTTVGSGLLTGYFNFGANRPNDLADFNLPVNFNSTLYAASTAQIDGSLAVASNTVLKDAVQTSGVVVAFAPIYSRSQIGANRYVTSGELGAGTGDAIKSASNYWTGTANVFGPSTLVQISGIAAFGSAGGTRFSAIGDLQTSGITVAFAPIYSRSAIGANRYVTSGELPVGAGTGDASRSGANFWTGSPNVFSATTLVHVSGLASFGSSGGTRVAATGDVQISGATLIVYDSQRIGNRASYSESLILGDPTTAKGFAAYSSNSVLGYSLQTTVGSGLITGYLNFNANRPNDLIDVNLPINFNSTIYGASTALIDGQLTIGGGTVLKSTVQTSGITVAFAPIYSRSQIGANRYVTSGEFSAGLGTGDAVKSASNYWTGTTNVFGPNTTIHVSGLASFGSVGATKISAASEVQVSGALLAYKRIAVGKDGGVGIRLEGVSDSNGYSVVSNVPSGIFYGAYEFWPYTSGDLITIYTNVLAWASLNVPNGVFSAFQSRFVGDVQLSGITVAALPIYARTQIGSNRYVTSGELPVGAGTGDAVKSATNYWTGTANVFGPSTLVQVSGIAAFGSAGGTRFSALGELQTSGNVIAYAPIYSRSAIAANRFVTSGELTAGSSGGVSWTEVTSQSQAMAVNKGYIASNSGTVLLTLPTTAAVGSMIYVVGKGLGGWRIGQNASQNIVWLNGSVEGVTQTTSGTAGRIDSVDPYDSVTLVAITANSVFGVIAAKGNVQLN